MAEEIELDDLGERQEEKEEEETSFLDESSEEEVMSLGVW